MQRHEHRATLRVRQGGTVIKRRIFVSTTCLQHLESLRFQCPPHLKRQVEHQVAFAYALRAAGSGVGASVRGIEHHNVQGGALYRRRSDGRIRRRLDRRSGLLGRSRCLLLCLRRSQRGQHCRDSKNAHTQDSRVKMERAAR